MFLVLVFLSLVKFGCSFEGYVVRGDKAQIEYFAHSVFLSIRDYQDAYICGSSILNQKILLSAAHCFESCHVANINAFVGNAHKSKGIQYPVSTFKIHEQYDDDEVKNDIGLAVLLKPLMLGNNVKRVAIVKIPPIRRLAIVAGWGLINEVDGVRSNWLHSSNQKLWSLPECKKVLPGIPKGTLCAGDMSEKSYASEGDSGSALMINDYIQVGLVSFKRPDTSRSLVVYTNVSYYYNWIKTTSRYLYCKEKLVNKCM